MIEEETAADASPFTAKSAQLSATIMKMRAHVTNRYNSSLGKKKKNQKKKKKHHHHHHHHSDLRQLDLSLSLPLSTSVRD